MMKKTIKIQVNPNSLIVSLSDILAQIEMGEKYFWRILWLEAIGKPEGKTMLELEEQVNSAKDGYLLSWNDLGKLANSLSQIINILLIGDKNENNLRKYNEDSEMYRKCTWCIELVDSSYWEINCEDLISTERLMKSIPSAIMVM